MEQEEKRKDLRIDSINILDIIVIENDIVVNQGMGRTLNVSESGILLETHFSVDLKSSLSLMIAMGNDLLYLSGKVIHSEPSENNLFKTGVQFVDIDQSALETIRKLIEVFKKQKEEKS